MVSAELLESETNNRLHPDAATELGVIGGTRVWLAEYDRLTEILMSRDPLLIGEDREHIRRERDGAAAHVAGFTAMLLTMYHPDNDTS